MNNISRPLLICISSLEIGGAEQCVVALANAALLAGQDVRIFVISAKGLQDRDAHIKNITSVVFLNRVFFLPIYVFLYSLKYPNAIVLLNFWTIALPVTILKLIRPRLRLVFWEHHWTSVYSKPAKFFIRLFFRNLDLVIGWSRSFQPLLALCPFLSGKVFPTGNPIVFPSYKLLNSQPNSIFSVCICSRLEPHKNIELSLYCLSLASVGRRIKIRVIGDGSSRAHLEKYSRELGIAQLCEFYGYRQDVLNLLRESDLCLITSQKEGFCNVVIESLSVGTPVISVFNGSVGDSILRNSDYGAVVSADRPDDIVSSIVYRYNIRRKIQQLGDDVYKYESSSWSNTLLTRLRKL